MSAAQEMVIEHSEEQAMTWQSWNLIKEKEINQLVMKSY